jgi:hypothetical protein
MTDKWCPAGKCECKRKEGYFCSTGTQVGLLLIENFKECPCRERQQPIEPKAENDCIHLLICKYGYESGGKVCCPLENSSKCRWYKSEGQLTFAAGRAEGVRDVERAVKKLSTVRYNFYAEEYGDAYLKREIIAALEGVKGE